MKLTFVLSFTLLYCAIQAQTLQPQLPKSKFRISPTYTSISSFFSTISEFEKSIVYLDNQEAIVATELDKKTREGGIAKINGSGKVVWQTDIPGRRVLGIALLEGQALVLTDVVKDGINLNASLIDIKTGKLLKEKQVYLNQANEYIEIKPLSTPKGIFQGFLVRISELKYGKSLSSKKYREQSLATSRVILVTLDKDLAPKQNPITPAGMSGEFLGAIGGVSNQFYYCTALGDQLIVEQYSLAGAQTGKLQKYFETHDETYMQSLAVDTFSRQGLLVAMQSETSKKNHQNGIYFFDFAAKKVASHDIVMDKSYEKDLGEKLIKPDGVRNSSNSVRHMEVLGFEQTADKIFVLQQIGYSEPVSMQSRLSNYFGDALVVSVFDRSLNLVKEVGINKRFEVAVDVGRSLGHRIEGERLYLNSTALTGVMKYSTVFAALNTNTLSFQTVTLLSQAPLIKDYFIEGGATLWFTNTMLLPYIIPEGGFRIKEYATVLQPVLLP